MNVGGGGGGVRVFQMYVINFKNVICARGISRLSVLKAPQREIYKNCVVQRLKDTSMYGILLMMLPSLMRLMNA
jgi:hypothetical protein